MTLSLPQLGYNFVEPEYLKQALTHKSYHNEFEKIGQSSGNNEKLEFLGDSVLDLALSTLLIKYYPELNEGALSKIRASLVNEDYLSEVAKELNLNDFILLGKGEAKMLGAQKPRLLASCLEAIIGAIYRDGGYDQAHLWVESIYKTRVLNLDLSQFYATDYKTSLQEVIQKKYKITPTYKLLQQEGPDHDRLFKSQVLVDEVIDCFGIGRTKKSSEQMAAKKALEIL